MTEPSTPREPVVVARATTSSEAGLIVGYLRSAGVRAEIEDVQLAAYATTVGGQLRVIVPADAAEQAQDLLRRADHVDGADPGSDLDVGLPVDDDVRDYLKWKGDSGDARQPAAPIADSLTESLSEPLTGTAGLEQIHARGLPLLPLLALVALVVALIVLMR